MSDLPDPDFLTFGEGPVSFASSPVVATVFEQILSAVHDGRLQPGQRINDTVLAEQLGVSRTPVREALQRLREIGVIEASPSRFTRVAIVEPQQTADAMAVWVALYRALLAEVATTAPDEIVAAMRDDHEGFMALLSARDPQQIALANAEFFNHLVLLSRNPILRRAINSVVHVVRLGSMHLPCFIDLRILGEAQAVLLAALRDHDGVEAQQAMRMLELLEIPTDPEG